MKNNHGGKRKGAGRKLKPAKRIPTSISLEPELLEWVKSQPQSISSFINDSLKYFKLHQ